MTAGGDEDGSLHTTLSDLGRSTPRTRCCGLLKPKPKETASTPSSSSSFSPTLILVRHSERLDAIDKTYRQTPLGLEWPWDAPLTEKGWVLAHEVAGEFAEVHKEASFAVVATSPYRRCVETAMVISRELRIPIVLDQEMGEVWETRMGFDPRPWRTPKELKEMLKGHKVLNPTLPEGGYKLFGREPNFPEDLGQARNRMMVRFETYIRQSEDLKQNFILCTHADGIAAALYMFERGNADISKMDFCSRLVARRKPTKEKTPKGHEAAANNTFAKSWVVQIQGIKLTQFEIAPASQKLFEEMHMEACEENEQLVATRRAGRTKTDKLFDSSMATLLQADSFLSEKSDAALEELEAIHESHEEHEDEHAEAADEDEEEEVPRDAHELAPPKSNSVFRGSRGRQDVPRRKQ